MDVRKLVHTILFIGIATIVAAVGWWFYYYGGMADDAGVDLAEVLQCLYSTGGRCSVVRGISRLGGGTPYQPMVLWVGAGIFLVGVVLKSSLKSKR